MVGVRSGYEQPFYEVVQKISGQSEIRRYEARLAAEATVQSDDYSSGRNAAFRLLFDYISGSNLIQKEISMTAPVETVADKANIVRMLFFFPNKYSLKNVPEPTDSRVRVVIVPKQNFAVLRFSGVADEELVSDKSAELLELLKNGVWEISGSPSVFGYDPPWTLPLFRRNEVVLPVKMSSAEG